MRVFDLDTIFIDNRSNESLAVLFDIPEFHSLYNIRVQLAEIGPSKTFFEQLITIFLHVIEGPVLVGDLKVRVNRLDSIGFKRICWWMMGVDREQD
jgi:hypothetical protein